jgi:hypothetical protein
LFSVNLVQPVQRDEVRLTRIRRVSNVVQAMENLITQCDGIEEFHGLRKTLSGELIAARKLLTREIHL